MSEVVHDALTPILHAHAYVYQDIAGDAGGMRRLVVRIDALPAMSRKQREARRTARPCALCGCAFVQRDTSTKGGRSERCLQCGSWRSTWHGYDHWCAFVYVYEPEDIGVDVIANTSDDDLLVLDDWGLDWGSYHATTGQEARRKLVYMRTTDDDTSGAHPVGRKDI